MGTSSGVKKFGFDSGTHQGKATASGVNDGQPFVSKDGGGKTVAGAATGGGVSAQPAGVNIGDGTEDRKSNPTSKAGKRSGPVGSFKDNRLADVKRSDGLSVPRKRR